MKKFESSEYKYYSYLAKSNMLFEGDTDFYTIKNLGVSPTYQEPQFCRLIKIVKNQNGEFIIESFDKYEKNKSKPISKILNNNIKIFDIIEPSGKPTNDICDSIQRIYRLSKQYDEFYIILIDNKIYNLLCNELSFINKIIRNNIDTLLFREILLKINTYNYQKYFSMISELFLDKLIGLTLSYQYKTFANRQKTDSVVITQFDTYYSNDPFLKVAENNGVFNLYPLKYSDCSINRNALVEAYSINGDNYRNYKSIYYPSKQPIQTRNYFWKNVDGVYYHGYESSCIFYFDDFC